MDRSGISTGIREHVRSNMVGYVAVCCFAFLGTAQALPGKNTVDSGDIKNERVKGKDVLNESLGSDDVAGLTGADLSGNTLILDGADTTTGIYPFEMRGDGDDGSLAQIGKNFVYVRADGPTCDHRRPLHQPGRRERPGCPDQQRRAALRPRQRRQDGARRALPRRRR